MLFPYRFLEDHSIYKLQEYIDFLVLEVWCKADENVAYNIDLFIGCPDLKGIIEDFSYSSSTNGDLFVSLIQEVYQMLQPWTEDRLEDLAEAYRSNNDIKSLCTDKDRTPRIYKELDPALKDKLSTFFKKLFTDFISTVCKKLSNIMYFVLTKE